MITKDELLSSFLSVYDQHIQHLTTESERNHAWRVHMEKPVFDILKREYGAALRDFWNTYDVPTEGEAAFVLYETREHENLAFLIHNLAYFCRGWRGILFHSKENAAFVRSLLGHNADRVTCICLESEHGTVVADRNEYNRYMKSRAMWGTMKRLGISTALLAETDAYLRRPIRVEDIREVDYVCSTWAWNEAAIGGGGLTIRSTDRMLEICESFPELAEQTWPQDGWAAEGLRRLGGKVNNWMFTESMLHPDPYGVHQWWTFSQPLENVSLEFFLNYLTLKM